jgi:hypothetical protein
VALEIFSIIRLSDSILSKLEICGNVFEKAVAAGVCCESRALNTKLLLPSEHMSAQLQQNLVAYFKYLIYTVSSDGIRMRYNRTKSLKQIKAFLDAHCAAFEDGQQEARQHVTEQVWHFILGRATLTSPGSVSILVEEALHLFGLDSIPELFRDILHSDDTEYVVAKAKELVLSIEAIEEARAAMNWELSSGDDKF